MDYYCYACGWSGDDSDLINSDWPECMREHWMCGEDCPKCGSDNVGDVDPENMEDRQCANQ